MRRAARVDGNQALIVDTLRGLGASVHHLHSVGMGCPDLLVGYRRANHLVEVKSPGGKLSPGQVEWHDEWRGAKPVVLRSREDAIEWLVGL